jgi:hypothetical protein
VANFKQTLPVERVAERGREIYDLQVRPRLSPEHDGQFVAVDTITGEFEIDPDDYTAVAKLRQRLATAEIWLEQVGQPTAYRMRSSAICKVS